MTMTTSRRAVLAGAAAAPVLALPAALTSAESADRFASLTMRWREAIAAIAATGVLNWYDQEIIELRRGIELEIEAAPIANTWEGLAKARLVSEVMEYYGDDEDADPDSAMARQLVTQLAALNRR
jgi:hypothetical protein